MTRLSWLLGLLLVVSLLLPASAAAAETHRLAVPYRSQLDGNPYEEADCGPAVMAMVLAAYGRYVPTGEVRGLVNDLQGTWGVYEAGSFIENLAVIAGRYGLQARGLFPATPGAGKGKPGKNVLRRWTLAELRRALEAGQPVVPQVRYRSLPGHEESDYWGDHFVVLTGYDGDAFVYHDPVDRHGPGEDRRVPAAQLDAAWRTSEFPYAAFAVVGLDGRAVAPWTPPRLPGLLRRVPAA
ncbi:MAG TPA: C39 family peptidase [Chloroflexota bacterium]